MLPCQRASRSLVRQLGARPCALRPPRSRFSSQPPAPQEATGGGRWSVLWRIAIPTALASAYISWRTAKQVKLMQEKKSAGERVQLEQLLEACRRFNFSAASDSDLVVFGALRPGAQVEGSKEEAGFVDSEAVDEWVRFMKSNKIGHVLSLLGDDELEWYQTNLDQAMRNAYFTYARTSVFEPGARDTMLAAFDALLQAKQNGEDAPSMVVHCSGGSGRAGLGLALWLVHSRGMSPEDACKEVVQTAAKLGCKRRPDPEKLKMLIANGHLPRKK